MAASAVPFPPAMRWSRTLAHTLLACAASLALHAVALGGLAWLYHHSMALVPPAAEVHIASVYLAPSAAREETRAAVPAPEPVAIAPPEPMPPPRMARPEAPRPSRIVKAPRLAGPHPSLPPQAGEGVQPALAVPAQAAEIDRPALPLPPLAGEGGNEGRARAARTHAGIEWRVQDWLAQHRHYPRAARRSGAEGTVWVRFVLDRGGDLQGSEILESSGHDILDRAALDLLRKASPFPALPPELTTDEIELVLPIEYDLTRTGRG